MNLRRKATFIISGFPGVGKTYLFNNLPEGVTALDSDSSLFSWESPGVRHPEWPGNYIEHIKENLGKVDYIFVSSHAEVREALRVNDMFYTLVYPDKSLLDVYRDIYAKRGSAPEFIEFISSNWDKFIKELNDDRYCVRRIVLGAGENLYTHLIERKPQCNIIYFYNVIGGRTSPKELYIGDYEVILPDEETGNIYFGDLKDYIGENIIMVKNGTAKYSTIEGLDESTEGNRVLHLKELE